MKSLLLIPLAFTLLLSFLHIERTVSILETIGRQVAAIIVSHNPRQLEDIWRRYTKHFSAKTRVRVLLVPGHEPDGGGAEYKALKERDMTLELAEKLRAYLQRDPRFEVTMSRDEEGWNPTIADYFKNNWNDIVEWKKLYRKEMPEIIEIEAPSSAKVKKVYHRDASEDVATRLYGITKWANENKIDIEIHIHFNDHTSHAANMPGAYSGFAVYVPAGQYYNSTTTKAIAEPVFEKLAEYNYVSNLPGEDVGIVDEADLIAIGSNNTADAASMLIEYGYIYEPQFQDEKERSKAVEDLAYQTFAGLRDFFNSDLAEK